MNQSWHVHDSDDHTVPDNNKFMQGTLGKLSKFPKRKNKNFKVDFLFFMRISLLIKTICSV